MAYTIKYTSSRNIWVESVKKNESFVVIQSQSFPSGNDLKKHLETII